MSKKIHKITSLLLVGVMSLSVVLFGGCKKKKVSPTPPAVDALLYDPNHGIDRDTVLSSIVKEGKSEYKIVYGKQASETEKYAASEMQSFIYQMTGVRLLLIEDGFVKGNPNQLICIGENAILESSGIELDYSELGTDGFLMKTQGTNLYIVGGKRGTLYGVYDFLEKICGVKFIANDCTYTPQLSEIPLYSMNVTEIPEFENRGYLAAVTPTDQVWYARSRNNCEWMQTEEKYGGGMSWYTNKISSGHNALTYVSPNIYYKTEADKQKNGHMFYVNNGKVVDLCYTDGITEDGKLDESMSVSAAKIAIESLKTYIQDGSEELYYMFGHMDTRYMCACDDCTKMISKYGKSGVYIRFANVLYDEAQKWANENLNGRKLKFVIFAYFISEQPPVAFNAETKEYEAIDETVIPREDIYIRLAPIDSNRYYTVSDENQTAKKYNDWLKKWGVLSDKFMVWAYSAMHPQYFWYYPMKHTFVDTLKDYKEIGVKYMFMQGGNTELNDWQSIMDDYLMSKLLWNPNRDVNALVEEFVHYYFGEMVEEEVLAFMRLYDTYMDLAGQKDKTFLYNNYTAAIHNKYEDVNTGLEILNEAKQTLENSSLSEEEKQTYITRIDRVRITPLYMLMFNGTYYFVDNPNKKKEITNEFFETCERLNVLEYAERKTIDSLKAVYGYEG